MKIAKVNYILSEMSQQKSISLKDERVDHLEQLNQFKDRFTGETQRLAMQESIIKDLTQDNREETTLLENKSS